MTRIRSSRSTRVRDQRSSSGGSFGLGGLPTRLPGGGGGSGLPIGAGGGIVGLVLVLALVVLPRILGGGGAPVGDPGRGHDTASDGPTVCSSELEQIVCGAVDDVSVYWDQQYPRSFQGTFPGTDTVFFSDVVQTGCGQASASMGPFYCPVDQLVYFDLEVLEQLQTRFGAVGDLAAQYIVAHEYGHHVQNVTGIAERVAAAESRFGDSANALSVAQELQADCFAGTWARSLADRGALDDPGEIVEAQRAAAAVGDDRIMEASGSEVEPEQFTHGSSEQRKYWFTLGYDAGDPERCTTFDGSLAP
jgi:predicted metalloprotease